MHSHTKKKIIFNITYAWLVIQAAGGKILANLVTRLDALAKEEHICQSKHC